MKVVISGSASLQTCLKKWIEYGNNQDDYLVLDYLKAMPQDTFYNLYPEVDSI